MPEIHGQLDFFPRLDNKLDAEETKPRAEQKPRKERKNQVKKVRQFDINIPSGGRLGGWQSHYDGNLNDPNFDKE